MFSPKKVDGRWIYPPLDDSDDDDDDDEDEYMQHRQPKKEEEDTRRDPAESTRPNGGCTSQGNRMTQTSTQDDGQEPDQSRRAAVVQNTKMSLLFNNFFAMLESSPQPEEAFHRGSREYRCAWQWLNKLTTMTCPTVTDGRLRNAYMSRLSVCLNQRRLHEIFQQTPPEQLKWMDLSETSNQASVSVPESFANSAAVLQPSVAMAGPQRSLEPLRERTMESRRPQGFSQPPRAMMMDGPQRFQQQDQEYQQHLQFRPQPEFQRFLKQTESLNEPSVYSFPDHVGRQTSPHNTPQKVQFDAFGAPPRFIGGDVEGEEVIPSEVGGESIPPPASATPKRSILKRRCIPGEASQECPAPLMVGVSFSDTPPYSIDQIRHASPSQSHQRGIEFPKSSSSYKTASNKSNMDVKSSPREGRKGGGNREEIEALQLEQRIKGSIQEQKQQKTRGTQMDRWSPESSDVTSEETSAEVPCEATEATLQRNRHRDMTILMDSIRRELRGEASEGQNAYLEGEIRRYSLFASQYRCHHSDYKRKMLGGDPRAQREYLLLNMKKDLTKLMST